MLLTKREKNQHPLADMDPFGSLSLFDELWPSSFLAAGERPYTPAMDVVEATPITRCVWRPPAWKRVTSR